MGVLIGNERFWLCCKASQLRFTVKVIYSIVELSFVFSFKSGVVLVDISLLSQHMSYSVECFVGVGIYCLFGT